ncbi:putative transcription factor B3-domain family [Haematococcus lacustris]|uniref:Putative transcription factor B3-domain family n=1 Tax=Haematococcus lacustris TaxID=44745 RepID=A0A699YSX0_HAELA|nr:putative transcription factor B3-domain family [Haematococcus lacustris]
MAIHDAGAGLSDFEKQRLERIRLNKLRMNAILDAKQALDAACNNEAPRASRAPATRKEPKEQEVIERKSLRSRSQVVSYRDSARSGAYTTEAVSKMPGVWHPCLYGASLEASRLAQAAAEEHRQALLQAGSSCSDIKVEEGFWLHLPSPWWRKHQHLSRTWVCLVCSDKWPSADYRLTASEQSSSGSGSDEDGKPSAIVGDWWWVCVPVEHTKSGGLSGGWRSFSIDHDLTIGDCIWFEDLGSRTWKVHIFREPPEGLDEPSVEGWADTAALCDLRSLPKQQPRWGRQGDIASAGNLEASWCGAKSQAPSHGNKEN